MNFIRKQLYKMVCWINSAPHEDAPRCYPNNAAAHLSEETELSQDNCIRFSIYGATGGKVVQLSTYDRKNDRRDNGLYIIADGENLGEELELIIFKHKLSS